MRQDNVNIEELRKIWVAMGDSLGMSGPDVDPERFNDKRTALDRLRNKYRFFWTFSIFMMIFDFLFFSCGRIVEGNMGFYLGLAYLVYFFVCFMLDHWLWSGICSIDPVRMGVAVVAEKSMLYRKRHLQFMVVLIPLAILLIGFTGYVFSSEKYFLSGMITGALCGAVIGIVQFRRFMADYKKLSE